MSSRPSLPEFVTIIALVMSLASLSIDNLLPAFGVIRETLSLSDPNRVQLVITVYMAAFAVMQLVYGPLSDRFGRKPVLLSGLGIYVLGTGLASVAGDFETLLVARAIQGVGAAASRVLAIAIVRDCYNGRDMARVMSLTMMVFIIVPVIAPSTGALFLLLGSWRLIFASVFVLALAVMLWIAVRLPETRVAAAQALPGASKLMLDFRRVLTTRAAMGNATALALMMGGLMTYLGSSPQIFGTGHYDLGQGFLLAFAAVALAMGAASFVNSLLVRQWGMRRLSQIGLCGFVVASTLLTVEAIAFRGLPPLYLFVVSLAAAHFLMCLTVPNSNAMAMEGLGDIAGTASSLIGFYTTLLGAIIGYICGNLLGGDVLSLCISYLALSAASLACVLWTEKGRLFVAQAYTPASLNPAQGKS